MSFIQANGLYKTYGSGAAAVSALGGVSLEIGAGEFVAVMGPSGSGKSTLLAVLGALNTPERGNYGVDGIEVFSLSQNQRADFRREYLGFVFQSFNLVPYLSLAENVMLPLAIKRLPKKDKLALAHVALERVGLAGKEARLPGEVSGGEQERAAVARALVNQPPILLADEPTGNLDQANTQRMMELLQNLGAEGMTIVMVTHSATCAGYAGRVLNMRDGLVEGEEAGPALAAACMP
ncbi:MAG: ABC transporter ATP-binding protein [Desulfarculaceae bacterium]|nr:ABC transporter ATP-binding protein [Desulfarculaceae bacterium]MCF8072493.1 ABC transporter ATP-binding protein [Desulfarculaceae bacterium]MCF8102954.1 ABC transporter ATP-binding protein [Desulfarculaceae bacterium]MCF8117034.1 ABC transporter ATP-binding protein [Desulfarculaceae bacterium]